MQTFFSMANPDFFLFYFVSYKQILQKKSCMFQQDSNSDCRIDHHDTKASVRLKFIKIVKLFGLL